MQYCCKEMDHKISRGVVIKYDEESKKYIISKDWIETEIIDFCPFCGTELSSVEITQSRNNCLNKPLGVKVVKPKNPVALLKYAVPVLEDDARLSTLIAYDDENKEIVVYRLKREDPDGTKTYTGSVEAWDDLPIEQQNTLIYYSIK